MFSLAIRSDKSVYVTAGFRPEAVGSRDGERRPTGNLTAYRVNKEETMPSQVTLKDAGPKYFEALAAAKNPRTVDTYRRQFEVVAASSARARS